MQICNGLRSYPSRIHLNIPMGDLERKHCAVFRACLLHRTLVNCHYLCLTHDQAALFICLIPRHLRNAVFFCHHQDPLVDLVHLQVHSQRYHSLGPYHSI